MHDDDELTRLRQRVRELEANRADDMARIGAILAHIPAVLYVKDSAGRYVFGSTYGFELLGVTAAEAIGRTSAELFPGELGDRFTSSDRRVLGGEHLEDESYAVPLPDGPRHFLGARFPIPGPGGEPIGIFGFAVDITRRIELERELQRLARTDPLTSVGNRRHFDEALAAELARAGRSGEPLSLLLCDVDHFKRFNDHYGHPAGDACLAGVARAIAAVARRPADLVARYGGEEFAIVLSDTPRDGAIRVAARLQQAVRALAIPHAHNDGRGVITVSAGVASVTGSWAAPAVLQLADQALYQAKAQGRDRFVTVEERHQPASAGRPEPAGDGGR